MKILVFEYITGGGLCREELPASLAAEGRLMVTALLRDLSELEGVEVLLLLDTRVMGQVSAQGNVSVVEIGPSDDLKTLLVRQLACCDAVWPVAPEMDNILLDLTRLFEKHSKPVLSSPSNVVASTADKLSTYRQLKARRINAVATDSLQSADFSRICRRVVKPVDGMGCERTFIVDGAGDLEGLIPPPAASERYIVQPFVEGRPKSLSCLFKSGKGWLLSVNTQRVQIVDRRFILQACRVNEPSLTVDYRQLLDQIADAFPDLWGYAGIDFIETPEGLAVLEINPRLTTSYAGIHRALGLNVAEQVVSMLNQAPEIKITRNETVTVSIEGQGL